MLEQKSPEYEDHISKAKFALHIYPITMYIGLISVNNVSDFLIHIKTNIQVLILKMQMQKGRFTNFPRKGLVK